MATISKITESLNTTSFKPIYVIHVFSRNSNFLNSYTKTTRNCYYYTAYYKVHISITNTRSYITSWSSYKRTVFIIKNTFSHEINLLTGNCLLKVDNGNTRTICEIWTNLDFRKTPMTSFWYLKCQFWKISQNVSCVGLGVKAIY